MENKSRNFNNITIILNSNIEYLISTKCYLLIKINLRYNRKGNIYISKSHNIKRKLYSQIKLNEIKSDKQFYMYINICFNY